MITKLMGAVILALVLFGCYELVEYYGEVKQESETKAKEVAAKKVVGEQLPGMNYDLQQSLAAAQQAGPKAFGNWLSAYGRTVQDPRLAWSHLDYVVAISREDTATARQVFAAVKDRTPSSSPVYFRIQELAKSYE